MAVGADAGVAGQDDRRTTIRSSRRQAEDLETTLRPVGAIAVHGDGVVSASEQHGSGCRLVTDRRRGGDGSPDGRSDRTEQGRSALRVGDRTACVRRRHDIAAVRAGPVGATCEGRVAGTVVVTTTPVSGTLPDGGGNGVVELVTGGDRARAACPRCSKHMPRSLRSGGGGPREKKKKKTSRYRRPCRVALPRSARGGGGIRRRDDVLP